MLGIDEPALPWTNSGTSISSEWMAACGYLSHIYSPRHQNFRKQYDVDCVHNICGVLDRCKAGGYGVKGPCTENGAGKDLWDAYLRELQDDDAQSSSP